MEVTVVPPFGAVPLMTHVITIFTTYVTNTTEAATLGFNLHANTPPFYSIRILSTVDGLFHNPVNLNKSQPISCGYTPSEGHIRTVRGDCHTFHGPNRQKYPQCDHTIFPTSLYHILDFFDFFADFSTMVF